MRRDDTHYNKGLLFLRHYSPVITIYTSCNEGELSACQSFDKSRPHIPLMQFVTSTKWGNILNAIAYRTIQSIINNARFLADTCLLQYTLLQAYIPAKPPMNENFPISNTAALPR